MSHRTRKPARHGAAPWLRLTLALLVTLSALAALPTRVARAAACMVTSAADSGAGSLRAAINNTDGFVNCTDITFQAGLGPITLDTRIDINHPVNITGPGQVVQHNAALPPAGDGGVLGISGGTVVITGLTIQGGNDASFGGGGISITAGMVTLDGATVRNNKANGFGGGILNIGGNLTLTNSTVSGNESVLANGGGIYHSLGELTLTGTTVSGNKSAIGLFGKGGGIYAENPASTVTLTGSTVSDNETSDGGGGIFAFGVQLMLTGTTVSGNKATNDGGGLYLQSANTTLTNSTVSGNQSKFGGGGGVFKTGGTLALVSSTVSGNSASDDETVEAGGGGIFSSGTLLLTNVTISGNTAGGDGGGLFIAGATTLRFVTVTGNVADNNATAGGSGGGIFNASSAGVLSSIVAGNRRGAATPDDCGTDVSSSGHNLTGVGCVNNGTTDIAYGGVIGAVLNPTLADNGGPTKTHALVAGSPARNNGDNVACTHLPPNGPGLVDQRGVARNDGQCDIGAFESEGAVLSVTLTGDGTVERDPAGTGSGPFTYAPDTVVTLTAQPAAGHLFTGWTLDGNPAGWAPSVTLTMDVDHTVGATFVAAPAFGDVPGDANFADPVAQLAARGVINGCDATATPPLFCPTDSTLREQMAALIVRAISSWQDETWPNPFSDPTSDAELMRRVATLGHYQVAQGYQAEVCAERGVAAPCFGPLDNVTYGQTILLIARAMVAKGYWTLQPDNRAIFPDQNGAIGADPDTDRQTLDHRMVVTYVFYAGAPPDLEGAWGDASPRGWFARVLWQALNSYFGTDRMP